MTGHGRAERARKGCRIGIEISSVNRRQAEVAVSLPRELESLEPRVRDYATQRISRGRLQIRITFQLAEQALAHRARLNLPLARAYVKELREMATHLRLPGEVTLDQLLRIPGVLKFDDSAAEAEQLWPLCEEALDRALHALIRMREREGQHLAQELARRIQALRRGVDRIRRVAPSVMDNYRRQLRERIRMAGLEAPAPDDERLARELVYFADRSDVTEELTRLESHFAQFDDLTRSEEPIGRTLDFLAQEINREINTIGSKANDSRISSQVVLLKTELEKFREQAQNVE